MFRLEHSVVIDRPIEEVFAFLHDPVNDAKWQGSTIESQQVSEGPFSVGTTVRQTSALMGWRLATTYEITEYDPPTKSAFRGISGPIGFTGRTMLEPTNGGTKVTGSGGLHARGLAKFLLPIVTAFSQRDLRTSFARLKELLESRPSDAG